jgi:hypothetical protein
MHNCKAIKERLTELALDGANASFDEILSAELRDCAACREEFAALKDTLRITTRLMATVAAPTETYWPGYHARLKQKLAAVTKFPAVRTSSEIINTGEGQSWIKRFLTLSIPVPVPIGITLLLVFGFALIFISRAARREVSAPQSTSSIVRVEVPVIQEKLVTHIVYRERSRVWLSRKRNQTADTSKVSSALANNRKPAREAIPLRLVGFKPLEEIKLTLIKGGTPDEK